MEPCRFLRTVRRLSPFVTVIFTDGAYQGQATADAVARTGRWRLGIVKRSYRPGFVPLPKHWIRAAGWWSAPSRGCLALVALLAIMSACLKRASP
jgi:hypothetical protein